eukprot:snap_masked-scaffold452_size166894-processed-gene-0.28 protein:Tk11716 transcript:snap_masked-scaffold452_size166894-processed-gene-0.28-mRNA-1 annotation:"unknown"
MKKLQGVLNDLMRLVANKRISDKISCVDLSEMTGIPSLNRICASATLKELKRASDLGWPLADVLEPAKTCYGMGLRSQTSKLARLPGPSTRKGLDIRTMATLWNQGVEEGRMKNSKIVQIANATHCPKDLRGLLKFCMETTKNEDAPVHVEGIQSMDPERRKWLEEFLRSSTVDVIEQLTLSITALSSDSVLDAQVQENDLGDQKLAFEAAGDWVGQVDMANNFHKLGGYQALDICLKSPHSMCRQGGCHLFAELVQNNPYCQEKIVKEEFLPKFLALVESDPDETCRVKALYALSCSIRASDEAFEEFVNLKGIGRLIASAYGESSQKLKLKTSYLILALLDERPSSTCLPTCLAGDVPSRMVQALEESIPESDTNNIHLEVYARLLCTIIKLNPASGQKIAETCPQFTPLLRQTWERVGGNEQLYEFSIIAMDLAEVCGSALSDDEKTRRLDLQSQV